MDEFTSFFDECERKRFQSQVRADPSQINARYQAGDEITRAGLNVAAKGADDSVKARIHHICSALIHISENIGAVTYRAEPMRYGKANRVGLPPVMWVRCLLAVLMLLLGTFWAGTYNVTVTCMADAPAMVASPAAPVGTTGGGQPAPPPSASVPPSKVICSQTVPVPQSGTLASALVNIGLVLLLLEAAAALKRKFSWVPLLQLPAWMDPYVREVATQQAPEKISSTVNVAELEASIARAFEELDQAQLLFQPPADSKEVSVSLLSFLQQSWSLATAGDTGRLQRQMKNIEGLLEANGYKLVPFTEPDRDLFEIVLQPSIDEPQTVLPAMVDATSRRVVIQGQAFVAHR